MSIQKEIQREHNPKFDSAYDQLIYMALHYDVCATQDGHVIPDSELANLVFFDNSGRRVHLIASSADYASGSITGVKWGDWLGGQSNITSSNPEDRRSIEIRLDRLPEAVYFEQGRIETYPPVAGQVDARQFNDRLYHNIRIAVIDRNGRMIRNTDQVIPVGEFVFCIGCDLMDGEGTRYGGMILPNLEQPR